MYVQYLVGVSLVFERSLIVANLQVHPHTSGQIPPGPTSESAEYPGSGDRDRNLGPGYGGVRLPQQCLDCQAGISNRYPVYTLLQL